MPRSELPDEFRASVGQATRADDAHTGSWQTPVHAPIVRFDRLGISGGRIQANSTISGSVTSMWEVFRAGTNPTTVKS